MSIEHTSWQLAHSFEAQHNGPGLSADLIEVEQSSGLTEAVAWSYATRLPSMLGLSPTAMLPYVVPLFASRGVLLAARLESPLEIPSLMFVQTSSVEVCEALGAQVPIFSIRDEACLRALCESGSAVQTVYWHGASLPDDLARSQAFEIIAQDQRSSIWCDVAKIDRAFIPMFRWGKQRWLCWDRDNKCAALVEGYRDLVREPFAPDGSALCYPSILDLVNAPRQYHGRRIQTRGALSWGFERNRFAGAWFRATEDPDLRMGLWLVALTGVWDSVPGRGYGHMSLSDSEVRGTVELIDISTPRPVDGSRYMDQRPYVPLVSEMVIDRGLSDWRINGRVIHRMGARCLFGDVDPPDRCRAQLTYCVSAERVIGVFSWEILEVLERPVLPRTAQEPGEAGEYVEIKGVLTCDGQRWPLVDETLVVVPMPYSQDGRRYTIPNESQLETITTWLGDGGREVTIRGEVRLASKDVGRLVELPGGERRYTSETIYYKQLWALEIFDAHEHYRDDHAEDYFRF